MTPGCRLVKRSRFNTMVCFHLGSWEGNGMNRRTAGGNTDTTHTIIIVAVFNLPAYLLHRYFFFPLCFFSSNHSLGVVSFLLSGEMLNLSLQGAMVMEVFETWDMLYEYFVLSLLWMIGVLVCTQKNGGVHRPLLTWSWGWGVVLLWFGG